MSLITISELNELIKDMRYTNINKIISQGMWSGYSLVYLMTQHLDKFSDVVLDEISEQGLNQPIMADGPDKGMSPLYWLASTLKEDSSSVITLIS